MQALQKEVSQKQRKEKVQGIIKKKYIYYLELIDRVGMGCMYVKDLEKMTPKSLAQTYKDIQNLERLNVLGSFNNEGKKFVYLKTLAIQALGKPYKQINSRDSEMLRSSVRASLVRKGENFIFENSARTEALYKAVIALYPEQHQFWGKKRDLFVTQDNLYQYKKNQNMKSFKDFQKTNVYIESFTYTIEEKKVILKMIMPKNISEPTFTKIIEDLMFFWENLGEYDIKLRLVVFAPFDANYYVRSIFKKLRGHRKTRQWDRGTKLDKKFQQYFQAIEVRKLDIEH